MKIVVTLKQVPEAGSPLRIDGSGRWIEEADLSYTLSEADAYALEAALRLKEQQGGEVLTVSLGPERVQAVLRDALAKGADRAVHIDDSGQRDALGVARLLAAVIAPEKPDLVVTGLQSDDLGQGQTGVLLAELLGVACVSLALAVGKTESGFSVRREWEQGWLQTIEVPSPALLTVQSGGSKLRYATLMGIKRAHGKEVRRIQAAELALEFGIELTPGVVLEQVSVPRKQRLTQMLSGTLTEVAGSLSEVLRQKMGAR